MSSALGMNALQSLITWGVHATRCSGVPCAKEGTGETVAVSKASDTHNRAKGVGRSIQLFWFSMFIIGLASIIETDSDIVIMADRSTLVPKFALVAKRQPLELSTPLQSGSVCFAIGIGTHRPPRRRTSVQALGATPALTLHVEMMRG
jgi:hypothetical protein